MEKQFLNCFQFEVARQCQWAILAIEYLEEALEGLTSGKLAHEYGMSRLWMSIQTFLVAQEVYQNCSGPHGRRFLIAALIFAQALELETIHPSRLEL